VVQTALGPQARQAEKPDLKPLWETLGIAVTGDRVVWQNPVPVEIRTRMPKEMVFITRETPSSRETIARRHETTAQLNTLFFSFAGAIAARPDDAGFTPLATTSDDSGLRPAAEARNTFGGDPPPYVKSAGAHVVAAEIRRQPPEEGEGKGVRAIVVADLDCIADVIVQLRDQPNDQIPIPLDNLTFFLNCVDSLAGDRRFLELRGRRPELPPPSDEERQLADALRRVENDAQRAAEELKRQAEAELEASRAKAEQTLRDKPDSQAEVVAQLRAVQEKLQKSLDTKRAELERQRARELAKVRKQHEQRPELVPTK
jgi:ABC-2 type transport system permease protein